MEAKPFHSRAVNPLALKPFACKWSEDDQISILTEKGVHVFEIIPTPNQAQPILNLSRTFIYPPKESPTEFDLKKVLSDILNWKREDILSLFMIDSIMPDLPDVMKVDPEIVDVFWSPSRLTYSNKCLLLILTSRGEVELAMQVNQMWISIFTLSTLWRQIISNELELNPDLKVMNLPKLKEQIYRLVVTTATWSYDYHEVINTDFAYLVTAHENYEVVVWKVYRMEATSRNMDLKINVQFILRKKLNNSNLKINSLIWASLNTEMKIYCIIIGFHNGQIGVMKLQEIEQKMILKSYTLCFSDIDNIPVKDFHVLKKTKESLELLVIKGMHLIILVLNIDGMICNNKSIISPGFSISGVSVLNSSSILIATQDGQMFMVQKNDGQDLKCIPVKVETSNNHVQYLGLAHSSNRLLFSLITSPSIIYDHLIDRDPSFVHFLCLFQILAANPLDILYSNKEKSLWKAWDCLELIKIHVLKYDRLSQYLSQLDTNVESSSLHKIRIAYWMTIINSHENNKFLTDSNSSKVEHLKSLIFLKSALQHLSNLTLSESSSQSHNLIISLLTNYLKFWLAGEEVESSLSRDVKHILETKNISHLLEQESCNFCENSIIEPWTSFCQVGHMLIRCALTYLQISNSNFYKCDVCHELFHPCFDSETNDFRCLYCDLPVYYKDHKVDTPLQTSGKLLSRKNYQLISKQSGINESETS